MSVLGFIVPLAQGCSWQEPQFRVTVFSRILLCAKLLEGTGFHLREPVVSSPQPRQLKSHQLYFRDGKRRLSQSRGPFGWRG